MMMSEEERGAFAEACEAELSDDAKAILACARRWGEPFTRTEIVGIAPGAEWDMSVCWPRTVASVDPIRELLRAGLIEVADEQQTRRPVRRGQLGTYKIYKLTGPDAPRSLRELLEAVVHEATVSGFEGLPYTIDDDENAVEILNRFGRS